MADGGSDLRVRAYFSHQIEVQLGDRVVMVRLRESDRWKYIQTEKGVCGSVHSFKPFATATHANYCCLLCQSFASIATTPAGNPLAEHSPAPFHGLAILHTCAAQKHTMAPIPDSLYFPPLEPCLRGERFIM
jgi:hypothetical protein